MREKKPIHLLLAGAGNAGAPRCLSALSVNGTNSQEFAEKSTTGFRSKTDLALADVFEV